MAYNRKDHYFKKAKTENYAARSIYKLEEIDARLHLLKPGNRVLDLGAAPGSWSQYVSKKLGPNGKLLSIDLQEIRLTLPNTTFIQADLRELDLMATITQAGFTPEFHLVLSDMAPNTTGIRFTDQQRSVELCELALNIAIKFLVSHGHFVCKLFHSGEFEPFRKEMRKHFSSVEVLRPKSTRKESKEIFLIGMDKKFTAEIKSK